MRWGMGKLELTHFIGIAFYLYIMGNTYLAYLNFLLFDSKIAGTCTCGKTANKRALILRRITFPVRISASSWEMPSCNVSSCSTAFRLGGGVILKASKGFPLLKCRCQSMIIAKNTKTEDKIYLIHPLHFIINGFIISFGLSMLSQKVKY